MAMGQEAACTVRTGGKTATGKALLESKELIFREARGDFRLKIPFRAMKSVKAADGRLRITGPDGVAEFELGPQAAKWAERILHPKSRIEKLGVGFGALVSVVGISDEGLLAELRERTPKIALEKPHSESDWIFLGAESKNDFKRIPPLVKALEKSGSLWIVYPKGQKHITENDVLAAGRKAGLKDVKVVGFSGTHTALKFVIPLARR
jgi:hypothetical protein